MTRGEKAVVARELRAAGWKYREIAERFGEGTPTVWRWVNNERVREQDRKRRMEQRDRFARKRRERRQRTPEKERARGVLQAAIHAGRVVRPDTCERCGDGGQIQAHHPDYSKPYEVMWLCRLCHGAEHGRTTT